MLVEYRGEKQDMKGGMTARDLLLKLNLDPEAVLVVLNGKLVDDSVILQDQDAVKLVAVVSGGH